MIHAATSAACCDSDVTTKGSAAASEKTPPRRCSLSLADFQRSSRHSGGYVQTDALRPEFPQRLDTRLDWGVGREERHEARPVANASGLDRLR